MKFTETLTISDIIRFIGVDHERTCILETESGKLLGVISQGDIIKAIWNGAELITPISSYINPNPIYIDDSCKNKDEEVLEIFSKHGILLIPVINKEKKIIDILSVRKIIGKKYGN
jgi:CBS domain-containing protein